MWDTSADRPVGAIYLARDGLITVGAAGATNTSGKGGPLNTSRGQIPLDAANRYVISIEAANDGVGEPWPNAQLDSYLRMVRALCDRYGLKVAYGDVHSHWEWTTRKVDPAGNSPYATGGNKWNMDAFRADVSAVGAPPPPNPDPPTNPATPIPGGSDVFHPLNPPIRNSDTRAFGGDGVGAGVYVFGLNPAIPKDAIAVALNVAAVEPKAAGFLTVWPDGPRPDTSCVNFPKGGAWNGAVVSGVVNHGFSIYTNVTTHLIADVTGYWTP